MSLTPSIVSINGRGKPLIIVEHALAEWTSFGTLTFSATTVQEAAGSTVNISSSDATENTVITSTAHGLTKGMYVRIAGHSGSTPDINGDHEVTLVVDTTTFKIGVEITVGGTGGTMKRIPDFRLVKVGARVTADKSRSPAPPREVWGKITAVDVPSWTITVDRWRQGTTDVTPDGTSYVVNGKVITLPYCYEMTEIFEPDVLVHPLHRTTILPNRVRTKFFGWFYTCILDYARHIHADVLVSMRPALNLREEDNIVLIPHEDKPALHYNVYHSEAVQLSRYGISPGHRKPIFTFRGKETIPSWPLPESGYGFGYATHYGTQL